MPSIKTLNYKKATLLQINCIYYGLSAGEWQTINTYVGSHNLMSTIVEMTGNLSGYQS